jgi:single-strand DNA-binding protein
MIRLSVIGYLGHDAAKKIVNGKSVLTFSVAQNERFRDTKGGMQEKTTWVNCSWWERDHLEPYLRKGTQVFVEGRPSFNVYANKEGEAIAGINMRVIGLELLGVSGGHRVEGKEEEADGGRDEKGKEDDVPF